MMRVRRRGDSRTEELWSCGACALVAVLKDNVLTIANAGDSRGLLIDAKKPTRAPFLVTSDHNAREYKEEQRLKAEHPNESDIVLCRRSRTCCGARRMTAVTCADVKGMLQPTRAVGDFDMKRLECAPAHVEQPFTPPYITPNPEIYHVDLQQLEEPVLVLATDGVWDDTHESTMVYEIVKPAKEFPSFKLIENVLSGVAMSQGGTGRTTAD